MVFSELATIEKIYISSSLITSIGSLLLGSFVYLKDPKRLANQSYFFMSFSVALWSGSLFLCHTSLTQETAFFWNKLLHLGSIFIPLTFFHFILHLLGLLESRRKVLQFGYLYAFVLAVLLLTGHLIVGLAPKFDFRFWPVPGWGYPLFLLYFTFYAVYALWQVLMKERMAVGNRREQLKFIFIGVSIAFAGGATNYAYSYDIPIPPIGNLFVFSYVICLAYSIIKYRLMDISVVFTKLGIFVSVYTLVLGIPFLMTLQFPQERFLPMITMAVLATSGPFVYIYLQKKAEDRLLQEQRQYQATLIQASSGMGRIKELKMLLRLIVRIVTRAVKVEHTSVYVFDALKNEYVLGASLTYDKKKIFPGQVLEQSPLIQMMMKDGRPILAEEIRQNILDTQDQRLKDLFSVILDLNAALIVPSIMDKRLVGFLVLGHKLSKKLFTQADLSVFIILANQSALAIENAQFYADMQKTQEQLFKAEKMATIGIMADGLSHQINNRLHAMGFIAGDLKDTLSMKEEQLNHLGLKDLAQEFYKGFSRLEENVVHGRNIVQGLMKYTRKGEEGFNACDPLKVLQSALEMLQFKIRADEIDIIKNIPQEIRVKANFTQLQEVFFNFIDNAYDAMMQRKEDLKEEGYKPVLCINVCVEEEKVVIEFKDNGIGVKEEDLHKLFTPFFTTKLSSRKGTGLGLYVIRKIIEENHQGQIKITSQHLDGTTFKIILPKA